MTYSSLDISALVFLQSSCKIWKWKDLPKIKIYNWGQHMHVSLRNDYYFLGTVSISNVNLTNKYRESRQQQNVQGLQNHLWSAHIHSLLNIKIWHFFRVHFPEDYFKSGPNRWFFSLCDIEIWRMTSKNNMTLLLYPFKLCASFVAIWEFQLESQSRNAQFGA